MYSMKRASLMGKGLVFMITALALCLGISPMQALADVDTTGNNFTMIEIATNTTLGGTNDVRFTWDGTLKTSVSATAQVSNATLSSSCTFSGSTWTAHDTVIYGPGEYKIYLACDAGSPGCGKGTAQWLVVGPDEIGLHSLLTYTGTANQANKRDVFDVLQPQAVFAPSPMCTGLDASGECANAATCGSNPANTQWDWMSRDRGDGLNGIKTQWPPLGNNAVLANFNLMGDPCGADPAGSNCSGNVNLCNTNSCDTATGTCIHAPRDIDDNNPCTVETCDLLTGIVSYPTVTEGAYCDDNDPCTLDDGACYSGNCRATRDTSCYQAGIAVSDSVAPVDDQLIPFGSVTKGMSSTQTVTIANTGTFALNVSDMQLIGADAGEFSLDVNSGIRSCGSTELVSEPKHPNDVELHACRCRRPR